MSGIDLSQYGSIDQVLKALNVPESTWTRQVHAFEAKVRDGKTTVANNLVIGHGRSTTKVADILATFDATHRNMAEFRSARAALIDCVDNGRWVEAEAHLTRLQDLASAPSEEDVRAEITAEQAWLHAAEAPTPDDLAFEAHEATRMLEM